MRFPERKMLWTFVHMRFKNGGRAMDILTLRIDLSQEAQDRIASLYATAVQHTKNFTQNLVNALKEKSELCQEKNLKNSINYFVDFYNMALPGIVESSAHEWRESDSSVKNVLIATENDNDDTMNTAQSFENRLYDISKSLFESKLDKLSHSTAMPKFSAKDMQESAEMVQKYLNEMEELHKEAMSQFQDGAEENAIYSAVSGLVEGTMRDITASFENAMVSFNKLCAAHQVKIPAVQQAGSGFAAAVRQKTSPVHATYASNPR